MLIASSARAIAFAIIEAAPNLRAVLEAEGLPLAEVDRRHGVHLMAPLQEQMA